MKKQKPTDTKNDKPMKERVICFLKDEKGATAIEYGLIASVISVAIVASVTDIGSKVLSKFSSIETLL